MKPRRLQRATIFSIVTGSVVLIESATVERRCAGGRPGRRQARTYTHPAMPIYEYRCENGHTFEVMQRMTDDPVEVCETCSAPVQRVFHPVAVHFKGSGFYNTDYGTRKRAREKDSAAAEGKDSKADSKSESKSESKSDSKSNSKSESKSESKAAAPSSD